MLARRALGCPKGRLQLGNSGRKCSGPAGREKRNTSYNDGPPVRVSLHSIGEKGDDFEVPLVFLHGLLGSSNNFRSVVLIRDHDPPFERTALFCYACSFCLPGYEVAATFLHAAPHCQLHALAQHRTKRLRTATMRQPTIDFP